VPTNAAAKNANQSSFQQALSTSRVMHEGKELHFQNDALHPYFSFFLRLPLWMTNHLT